MRSFNRRNLDPRHGEWPADHRPSIPLTLAQAALVERLVRAELDAFEQAWPALSGIPWDELAPGTQERLWGYVSLTSLHDRLTLLLEGFDEEVRLEHGIDPAYRPPFDRVGHDLAMPPGFSVLRRSTNARRALGLLDEPARGA